MPTAAHHTIIHHFRNRSGLPTALLLSGLPTASVPDHFSGHPTALLCSGAVVLPLLSGHPTARMVSLAVTLPLLSGHPTAEPAHVVSVAILAQLPVHPAKEASQRRFGSTDQPAYNHKGWRWSLSGPIARLHG